LKGALKGHAVIMQDANVSDRLSVVYSITSSYK